MARVQRTVLGSVAAAAVMALALGQQATAAPSVDAEPKGGSQLSAMQRDLDLTAGQAEDRLASEADAAQADEALRQDLGEDFAGSWYDAEQGTLVVAVTDASQADAIRAEGVQPLTVERSEEDLDAAKAELDAAKAEAPDTVAGWYVDVESNQVVVSTRDAAAGEAFVDAAGAPDAAVTVETTTEQPRPLIDVVGGNAYFTGSSRCSVGFAVSGGFVTAGHCGPTGARTSQPGGTFAGSSFPGNDYAYVRVDSGNTLVGAVNNYAGGRVAVRGSSEAPIGSSICRSGSTTGWYCGTIQARNSTVNYAEGSVTGLIRTTVCAEPGDSGGSAISGNQAQGVTSGGSGNCRTGGTTYFQPVNEILQRYGVSLVTS